MRRLLRYYILSLLVVLITTQLSAQLYTFRNYNHRDGLSMESILSCKQDTKGSLWIGTDGNGLMHFDGKKFIEAVSKPKATNFQFHVSSIYPSSNTIYFTSLYEGIYKYQNSEYSSVYQSPRKDGDMLELSMVDSNFVLITDYTIGLISNKGKVLRKIKFKQPEGIVVYQLLKIPQGVILLSSAGNYIINNKRITLLSQWYKPFSNRDFKPAVVTFRRNKLCFYDDKISRLLELVLNNDGSIFSGKITTNPFSKTLPETEKILKVAEHQSVAYIMSASGEIYQIAQGEFKHILKNYSGNLGHISGMYVDLNSDLWISNSSGLLKISLEPFTRVDLHPMYLNRNISVIHKTKKREILIGNMNGELLISKELSREEPLVLNYRTYGICESGLGIFVATDNGIYKYYDKNLTPTDLPYQAGKKIGVIHWDGTFLWYSPRGEGIVRYNPITKEAKRFQRMTFDFPTHFHTAQNNPKHSMVYFGTNNGICSYNKLTNEMKQLKQFGNLGSYSGISTIDKFGTCWFTMDKGLVGFKTNGKTVTLSGEEYFPSTLFYTLCSDQYGNLLAGTHKGINILEINQEGKIINQHNYSHKEGFGGYETHMRSQFQQGNYSYVGTIEGVYLINTEILRNFPPPPTPSIQIEGKKNQSIIENDNVIFKFSCLLPKSNAVLFSYRINGITNGWTKYSVKSALPLTQLTNGRYNLEVRASYDGIRPSNVARRPFVIQMPLWQTKWFIIVIIIVLGIINIAYLEYSKSYKKNTIFDVKDITIDIKMIPRFILFGWISNLIVLIIMESIEDSMHHLSSINLVSSALFLITYIISRNIVHVQNNSARARSLFYMVYCFWAIGYFGLIFYTAIHPFPVLYIVLITSVLPYILSNVRWVVVICLLQLFLASCLLIWVDESKLNEIYFISAIAISGSLAILITYLRNDSLEKLIFVNGIINKGNVTVIAFNQEGIITYCSENILGLLGVDSSVFINKPTAVLNPYVVSNELKNMHINEEFQDGKIILMPMIGPLQHIRWMEWSCKYFNDDVMAILGQDVTDKLTLSTNYQSLVENAQDMIYNLDVHGNFVFVNERCVQLFGYSSEMLIGKPSLSLVAPTHKAEVIQFYENQFKHRIHHTYLEFPIKTKSGRIFWVGQNVTMVYEPGSRKRISGFIALARDITEKRANELLIEQQNKDITASINYAKRIQINLLPTAERISTYFEDQFILFKPKEIISGDFYWMDEIDGKVILVIADCTGHGVPGAFMTILGINLLNQIVRERRQNEPQLILNELNKELHAILPQKEGTWYDGMDAIVAVFEKNKLCYASSGVAFVHCSNNELIVHKPHKLDAELKQNYEQECIYIQQEDSFYFFSDGYQQQFGSIKSKKFGFQRMEELLQRIKSESMPLQRKHFENTYSNWSEGYEQTDDITIIGVKGFKQI